MSNSRRQALRWGALLAFLGLFFMHGATASASEEHCGGSAISGHVHSYSSEAPVAGDMSGVHAGMVGMGAEAVRTEASIGLPVSTPMSHAGELCVAILLVGLLAFLVRGARRSFAPALARQSSTAESTDHARPPPRPSLSMLSRWRN